MTVTCQEVTPFGVCDLLATARCDADGRALCATHVHDPASCVAVAVA